MKRRLLEKAHEVLSHRRRFGEQQDDEDRAVVDAVHKILFGVGFKLRELHDAGIKDYGYNTRQAAKKLKTGTPKFVPGRRQEWTFQQVRVIQKHMEKYNGW